MSTSSSIRRCIQFSFEEIKAATNQFDESKLLGKGGEAKVYYAEIYIDSNKTPVAVKRLKNKRNNSKEFKSEINTLSKIKHHPNIVSLIGYCDESGQKILVYEYMEKGSLSGLFKKKNSDALTWMQRLSICLDVARGLQHLHSQTDDFSKGIIHRDMKPGNILVGENWIGKVSDFGMFKLSTAGQDKSTMATDRKGTSGYFAPEYSNFGRVTRKIDVFSFGVVLFYVLCEKSPWDREDESYYFNEKDDLGKWARENIDAQIRREISGDSLTLFTDIIRRSLQVKPGKRPTMDNVVLELQKVLECSGGHKTIKKGGIESIYSNYVSSLMVKMLGCIPRSFILCFCTDSQNSLCLPLLERNESENSSKEHDNTEEANIQADAGEYQNFQVSENPSKELEGFPGNGRCRQFSLEEIKAATNQFDESHCIGRGGEGKVYLAEIYIGSNKTPVAVKHIHGGFKEFEMEMQTMSKIQHPNIVSMLGYCYESGYKMVVYEYTPKGCLSDYLRKGSRISFSWLERLKVSLGAARGLQYLHIETDEYPKGIIHRDVNPRNIQVGENWVAKLSDFGIFKVSKAGQGTSMMTTNLKGTSGFFAPEYVMLGRVTRKIDVFAFGVVLFQVLCRKLPWDREDESYYMDENEDLGSWAHENVDAQIRREMSEESLTLFSDIIGRSLQVDPGKRPTMDDVVVALQKAIKCQEYKNLEKQLEDKDAEKEQQLKEVNSLKEMMHQMKQGICVSIDSRRSNENNSKRTNSST